MAGLLAQGGSPVNRKRTGIVVTVLVLAISAALVLPALATMPAYGPPSMTGKLGNALLWDMKRTTHSNFRGQAMRMALSRRGEPYVFGNDGPNSFDCSGLIVWAYARVGRSLPHSSYALRSVGSTVSLSNALAGDLLLYEGHVEMYAGKVGGTRYAVAAHQTGTDVMISPVRTRGLLKVVRVR